MASNPVDVYASALPSQRPSRRAREPKGQTHKSCDARPNAIKLLDPKTGALIPSITITRPSGEWSDRPSSCELPRSDSVISQQRGLLCHEKNGDTISSLPVLRFVDTLEAPNQHAKKLAKTSSPSFWGKLGSSIRRLRPRCVKAKKSGTTKSTTRLNSTARPNSTISDDMYRATPRLEERLRAREHIGGFQAYCS